MISNHHLRTAAAAAMLVVVVGVWPAQAQSAPHQADASLGAVIATQGTAAGAPACTQCHPIDGALDPSGAFPRIAGQPAYYLAKQMRDFTSGVRHSDIMSPVAQALSQDDIADVTAYCATVNAPAPPLAAADPALIKRGEELAKVGNAERQIPGCDNCHGPGGVGEPPAIPYLAGQFASYIALELQAWQRGVRKSSPESMAPLAKQLDDQEIAAVAAYYQQVRTSPRAHASR